jgi:hypothetical protein
MTIVPVSLQIYSKNVFDMLQDSKSCFTVKKFKTTE